MHIFVQFLFRRPDFELDFQDLGGIVINSSQKKVINVLTIDESPKRGKKTAIFSKNFLKIGVTFSKMLEMP